MLFRSNERLGSAGTQRNIVTLHHIWKLVAASGLWKDDAFLDKLASAEIELTAIASAYAQAVSLLDRGQVRAARQQRRRDPRASPHEGTRAAAAGAAPHHVVVPSTNGTKLTGMSSSCLSSPPVRVMRTSV